MNQNPAENCQIHIRRNNFYILHYYVIILHKPLNVIRKNKLISECLQVWMLKHLVVETPAQKI